MNGATIDETTTSPSWLIPLYPFTLKLVLDGSGNNATLNRNTLHDLTNGFMSEQLSSEYPTSFATLRLAWPNAGEENLTSCSDDIQVHEHHSIIQECVQTQTSGYALFNYGSGDDTDIPSRAELGELEVEMFQRNTTLKSLYKDMLVKESDGDAVLKSVSRVVFALDGTSSSQNTNNNNNMDGGKETKSINGSTKLGKEDETSNMDAISIAAIIAAGAVIVLVLALCYAWQRKAQMDKLRLDAIDARILANRNSRSGSGSGSARQTVPWNGSAGGAPSTIPSVTDIDDVDDVDSDDSSERNIIDPTFSDSQSAMMMSMSEIGNDYNYSTSFHTTTTANNHHNSQHISNVQQQQQNNELASIVSMDSYAFSIGEMESASRSFAVPQQRQMMETADTASGGDNDTLDDASAYI